MDNPTKLLALLALFTIAAAANSQVVSRTIGSVRAGRGAIEVTSANDGRVIVSTSNGVWAAVTWMTSAEAREWTHDVDSIANLKPTVRTGDVINYDGPLSTSARGGLHYARAVDVSGEANQITALQDGDHPTAKVALDAKQIARFIGLMKSAAATTDSLSHR